MMLLVRLWLGSKLSGTLPRYGRASTDPPTTLANCKFIILMLDLFEERRILSVGEKELHAQCRARAALYIQERAAFWCQRGKCRAIKEGDANTRYFHTRASTRLRHNRIQRLEVDGVVVHAHADKVAAVTTHYAGILGYQDATSWHFDLHRLYDGEPRAEAQALVAPFSEGEAKEAVRAMNATSAPGPDGVGPAFYKAAWATVSPAVMAFLHAFHAGAVDLQRINWAHIMLIPKTLGAVTPSAFRPVSLQNCPIKILTKILTTRLQGNV